MSEVKNNPSLGERRLTHFKAQYLKGVQLSESIAAKLAEVFECADLTQVRNNGLLNDLVSLLQKEPNANLIAASLLGIIEDPKAFDNNLPEVIESVQDSRDEASKILEPAKEVSAPNLSRTRQLRPREAANGDLSSMANVVQGAVQAALEAQQKSFIAIMEVQQEKYQKMFTCQQEEYKQEVASIRDDLQAVIARLDQVTADNEALTKENERLQNQVALNAEEQLREANKQLEEARRFRAAADFIQNEVVQKIDNFHGELTTLHTEKLGELAEAHNTSLNTIELSHSGLVSNFNNKIAGFVETFNTLISQLQNSVQTHGRFQANLAELHTYQATILGQLENWLNERKNELSRDSQNIKYLKNNYTQLAEKLLSHDEFIKTFNEQVVQMNSLVEALKSQMVELAEQRVDQQNATEAELNTKVSELANQLSNLALAIAKIEGQAGQVEVSKQEINRLIEVLNANMERVLDQSSRLTGKEDERVNKLIDDLRSAQSLAEIPAASQPSAPEEDQSLKAIEELKGLIADFQSNFTPLLAALVQMDPNSLSAPEDLSRSSMEALSQFADEVGITLQGDDLNRMTTEVNVYKRGEDSMEMLVPKAEGSESPLTNDLIVLTDSKGASEGSITELELADEEDFETEGKNITAAASMDSSSQTLAFGIPQVEGTHLGPVPSGSAAPVQIDNTSDTSKLGSLEDEEKTAVKPAAWLQAPAERSDESSTTHGKLPGTELKAVNLEGEEKDPGEDSFLDLFKDDPNGDVSKEFLRSDLGVVTVSKEEALAKMKSKKAASKSEDKK